MTFEQQSIQDAHGSLLAITFEQLALVIPAGGNTNCVTLTLKGRFSRVVMELDNIAAGQALDQCLVQYQAHPDADWATWVSNAELNTGTAIAGRLIKVVTNPTTLASGSKSQIILDTTALHAIRLAVSAAADSATINIRGTAGR